MGIEISRVHGLIADALDARALRQDMISSNIANVDTPNYRPRDIHFSDALAAKRAELLDEKNHTLEMAKTNNGHINPSSNLSSTKPIVFFRDGHLARNDGNSVDLDIETTEMSKNSLMFNALIQANKKDTQIFKSVIDASSKV